MQREKWNEKLMGSKPRARCIEKRLPPLERKGQRFLKEREREREMKSQNQKGKKVIEREGEKIQIN